MRGQATRQRDARRRRPAGSRSIDSGLAGARTRGSLLEHRVADLERSMRSSSGCSGSFVAHAISWRSACPSPDDERHDARRRRSAARRAATSSRSVASRSSELASVPLASARNASRRDARSAASRAAFSSTSAMRSCACRFACSASRIQLDEHLDLGAQNFRDDRRGDVIDRAERISLGHPQLVAVIGGDENDRRMRGFLAAANQRRRLEPVQPRHVDVEQDQRELALEHLPQRLVAGRRRVEVLVAAPRAASGRRAACPADRRRSGCWRDRAPRPERSRRIARRGRR